jgi:MFS family permease
MNDDSSVRRRIQRLIPWIVGLIAFVTIASRTSWDSPPRFDGAGYVVLARSISEGRGYRAIDHPDAPRHAHFPPGYPLALAMIRLSFGDDVRVVHLFSVICATVATVAAASWFMLLFGSRAGLVMGLALAFNWAWTRTGGGIQSEPLFLLLGQSAILAADRVRRRGGALASVVLGGFLGGAILTRQIGVALAAAVFFDLARSRRWRGLILALITMAMIVAPWILWAAWVSINSEGATQADLLAIGGEGLLPRILGQMLFYSRRIPDYLTGPFVEVATIFGRSRLAVAIATAWSMTMTLIVSLGWVRMLQRPNRRLAGLLALVSLGLLLLWPFTEAGRFLVPLIPLLMIGAIEGIVGLIRMFWFNRTSISMYRNASMILLAFSIPYGTYSLLKRGARSTETADRDFDMACAWIARQDPTRHPGTVLTRHPGEVFLQTGRHAIDVSTRERIGSRDASPDEVEASIKRYGVAYLLIDDRRYANAPPSPLTRFVEAHPDLVREVQHPASRGSGVSIYEVIRR